MKCLCTNQGTAAAECALCEGCFVLPENQAYAREMASQSDDIDPNSEFQNVSGNDVLECCICGNNVFGGDEP